MVARQLTGSPLAVEELNGREVTVEVVGERMRGLPYGSLFSHWSVRIVNELDRLPPGWALLSACNLPLDLLTERCKTRFQAVKLLPMKTEELAAFFATRWSVPKLTASQIAMGSGGCVRAALAALESWLDSQT